MSDNVCHVLMAIDASGSMDRLADDVIGGYNQYLSGLVADTDTTYYVTTALFNRTVWFLCERTPVSEAPRLTDDNYTPRDGTALRDAIGDLLVAHNDGIGDTDRVLVVVNTDGLENSSREWTTTALKNLIDKRKADPRWGFVFVGAGPEAWKQGEQYGFASTQSVNSRSGTRGLYSGLAANSVAYAAGRTSAREAADNIGAASVATDAENPDGQ